MPRSKTDILKDVSARLGPEGLALLNEMYTAFESEWKDAMVSAPDTDTLRQYQGRVRALREIRMAVKVTDIPEPSVSY